MFSREARDDLPPLPKATISVSLPALMRRWWPETLLVVLVLAAFMGCLGSVELWGKREQRAAAEAIDTFSTTTGWWPRSRAVLASRNRRCRAGRSRH